MAAESAIKQIGATVPAGLGTVFTIEEIFEDAMRLIASLTARGDAAAGAFAA